MPPRVSNRWFVPLAVAGAFTVASVVPAPGGSARFFLLGVGVDKWLHVVGSGGFAVALARALRGGGLAVSHVVALVLAGGLAFGAGIELLQAAVPTRNADHLDYAADVVGVVVGATAWWAVARTRR